jgi:N-acetyl-gamma-glutamylphosphate reductase
MSAGGTVSKKWSPKIGAQGCIVIDNSSAWRYDADVPLIVPEVNPDAISGYTKRNIIANPNCSTAQLVVALKPLHDHAKIKRHRGVDLPVGLRCRQGRHGRAVQPDPRGLRRRPDRARSSPSASPST